ncbi:hypothetical protein ACP70R_004438 [Stipagrostis hirtigluma subsp. patula]
MGKGGQDEGRRRDGSASSGADHAAPAFPAWARTPSEWLAELGVSADRGLSSEEAAARLQRYGPNELEIRHAPPSAWKLVLELFEGTLVRTLFLAAVVSLALALHDGAEGGEVGVTAFIDPLVIFVVLIVGVVVGVAGEQRRERALEALKGIQHEHATVKRDGRWSRGLPARDLVPGDIVELRVGDKVPADMRVVQLISSTLRVEQGPLTGGAASVNKTSRKIKVEDADIQGKECMVFAGTTVVNGSAVCVVTSTGMATEMGKINAQIQDAAQEEDDTPLKRKLSEFGEALTAIIRVICALVWLINVMYFLTWEYVDGWPRNSKFSIEKCTYYFEIAVALAVAEIPEGLPAVITMCLALGTRKMVQKNALVRKLPSAEALCSTTTVICSGNYTGTLTTNQMSAVRLVAIGRWPGTLRSFKVDGTTYDPTDGKIHDWPSLSMDENLQMIAKTAAICNDANIAHYEHRYVATGVPTEAALKVLVEKMGLPSGHTPSLDSSDLLRCCQWWHNAAKRIATLEFDRTRKSMGVIVKADSGKNSLLVKGAVENLLERCAYIQLLDGSVVLLDDSAKELILSTLREMSASALRCVGFAYKEDLAEFATYDGEEHAAHKDPPREEVYDAIEYCSAAGIRVMVITADNKETAEGICREIWGFWS